MFIVTAIRTVKGQLLFPPRVAEKFPNGYEFGFDISNSNSWKIFLSRYKKNGMYLPRKDKDGIPIVYRVYTWGGMRGVPRDKSCNTLFPAQRPITEFGKLIPLKGD